MESAVFSDVNNVCLVSLCAVFLGLCTIIFTIYKCVFMYLNALNKIAIIAKLQLVLFDALASCVFSLRLHAPRLVLHIATTNSTQMLSPVCFDVSRMKTLQRQIKAASRILRYDSPKPSRMYRHVMLIVCVNQTLTVALAGWSSGGSITEEAFEDVLAPVKVRNKSYSREQSI